MKIKENRRILVVDDEHSIHEDFQKILGKPADSESDKRLDKHASNIFDLEQVTDEERPWENYQVDCANNGEEAIEMVEKSLVDKNPYALVFMDFRMPPGINGVETTSKIWKKCPHTEVVLVTAFSDYSMDQVVKITGKTPHFIILRKPFDPQEIQQLALTLTTKWNLELKLNRSLQVLRRDRIIIGFCIMILCLAAIYIMYGSIF